MVRIGPISLSQSDLINIATTFVGVLGSIGLAFGALSTLGSGSSLFQDPTPPAVSETNSRTAPLPLGTTVTDANWNIKVNSVTLNANEQIAAASPVEVEPAEGNQYLMVNLSVTYTGNDSRGQIPLYQIAYVDADGVVYNKIGPMPPNFIITSEPLQPGQTLTGNFSLEVPSEGVDDGVLRVSPRTVEENVDQFYFAVK